MLHWRVARGLRKGPVAELSCYQLQLSAIVKARWYSTDGDNKSDDSDGTLGFVERILGRKRRNAAAKQAAAALASEQEAQSDALVVSSPEKRHHQVFVVELSRKPLFPGIYTPHMINKSESLVKELLETKKQGGSAYVGAFLKRPTLSEESEVLGSARLDPMSHLYEIGTFAQVHTVLTSEHSDAVQLLLLGHRRIRRTAVVNHDPLKVHVEHLKDQHYMHDDNIKAIGMEIVQTMRDLLHTNPIYNELLRTMIALTGSIDLQDPSRLVDVGASLTSADEAALQEVLEELNVPERARKVLVLLKREMELNKLQGEIRDQVEGKIMKEQRRMLLMEQLKSIKKELGLEKDDKSALIARFEQRFEPKKANAPTEVVKVVKDELEKLSTLEPASPEFNVTRTYLEWLTILPWGNTTPEIFDIVHAKKVLDEDHYGLSDVKERILEFIAVSRLRGSALGKILCLVGPPGVGKTSVGRSIARTLGRKYYRFSVGGLYDVAEIKGHRRTYVGAMPGKMVQCLKNTQASNPLVLIDEIDKLGRGHAGDPASALLELLDPEQNVGFLDHYLDVPIDLSQVLFVCTANVLDTIPGPLLDRMETIRLSGYTSDEKRAIARSYLEPQSLRDAGVPTGSVTIADPAMSSLIDQYCREAGVRNLKKQIEKVHRKAALKLVQAGVGPPLPVPKPPTAEEASGSARSDQDKVQPEAVAASQIREKGPEEKKSEVKESLDDVDSLTFESHPKPESAHADQLQKPDQDHPPKSDAAEIQQTGDTEGVKSSSNTTNTEPEKDKQPSEASTPAAPYTGPIVTIDVKDLKDYLGMPPFTPDKFYDTTPPGVVMGLAWTAMGGATLYVEAAKVAEGDAKGTIVTTGQLGDVFRESVTIAHTYARAYLQSLQPENKFFANTSIHVHVPAGSTPKDGPSAGCTIITALLSLALDRHVTPDLAMTGEVTLTGRVLPIGGVKEKVLAARRSDVKVVIFPEANRRDWEELTDDLKEGLEPHFVSRYDQVFELSLKGAST